MASAPEEAGGSGEEGALYYMPVGLDAMAISAAVTFYPSGKVDPLNIHIPNPFKKRDKSPAKTRTEAHTPAPALVVSRYTGLTPANEVKARITDSGRNYDATLNEQNIALLTDGGDGTITLTYLNGVDETGVTKEDAFTRFNITVTEEPAPTPAPDAEATATDPAKKKKILGIFPRKEKTEATTEADAEKKTFWQKLGMGKKQPVSEVAAPAVTTAPATPADPLAPAVTTAPATPADPLAPAATTAPATPADPVAPTATTAPATPADPLAPAATTAPVAPADPVAPATTTAPVAPADPVPEAQDRIGRKGEATATGQNVSETDGSSYPLLKDENGYFTEGDGRIRRYIDDPNHPGALTQLLRDQQGYYIVNGSKIQPMFE